MSLSTLVTQGSKQYYAQILAKKNHRDVINGY